MELVLDDNKVMDHFMYLDLLNRLRGYIKGKWRASGFFSSKIPT